MIKLIQENQLPDCLEVIHRSFATVAEEFELTPENCPSNGAFIPLSRLQNDYDRGNMMFGLYDDEKIIGFMEIAEYNTEICGLEKLAVLPEYRHNGYGKQLLDFAKKTAVDKGYKIMHVGIIDKNTRLKNWYSKYGFIHTGTNTFPRIPFVVGYMQLMIETK
jgi:Sortase and related acyltransferases